MMIQWDRNGGQNLTVIAAFGGAMHTALTTQPRVGTGLPDMGGDFEQGRAINWLDSLHPSPKRERPETMLLPGFARNRRGAAIHFCRRGNSHTGATSTAKKVPGQSLRRES